MSNELTVPDGNGSDVAETEGPQMEKLFEACQKLDRATEILLELKRDKEMVMELGQDLMPMANGIIHLTSDRLQEFEQDGTLDLDSRVQAGSFGRRRERPGRRGFRTRLGRQSAEV